MERSPVLRRLFNRIFYQWVARLDSRGDVTLMNYGYEGDDIDLTLDEADEADRYNLQLYYAVARPAEFTGRDVLEVGSGRGGGAAFLMRTLNPKSVTGVDFAEKSVRFAEAAHPLEGLRFFHGDAEDLPFDDASFDVVINVESSHCYGSMSRFVGEVRRVLRPGGLFLWADLRPTELMPTVLEDMQAAGFATIEQETITPQVLASLVHLSEKHRQLIDSRVPGFVRPLFYRFAGVDGTTYQQQFESGDLTYLRLALRAP
jgi:ubiquinone/menaquinone biosynthesis C-methylase UbiE